MPADPILRDRARRLRRERTDAERTLWQRLRGKQLGGLKFRRQHVVGPWILDFYCPECRLAVELDGGQHNEAVLRALLGYSGDEYTALLAEGVIADSPTP